MSDIDRVISTIQQFLAGNDQSDSPAVRQAVQLYARTCAEVNADLAKCRKLIDQGLLADSRKYAAAMKPPLTVRAAKLILPDEKFNRLQTICKLYGYESVSRLDVRTLKDLSSEDAAEDIEQQKLIRQWRLTARTGTSAEKIKLLRTILSTVPGDSKIWHSNLQAVEKQFLSELYSQSDAALEAGDNAKLNELYQEMSSPELLTVPDHEQLKKYHPAVLAYQQQIFNDDLQNKRNELFAAYGKNNYQTTTRLLKEYDNLCSHPLYRAAAIDENAVNEVRKYLADCEEKLRKEEEFSKLLYELNQAIEQRIPFPEIENIYAALCRTDLPVDEKLSLRIASLRQDYAAEKSRAHIRVCIYSVLTALILSAIGIVIVSFLQNDLSCRSYCATMQKLIADGNYDGVFELHEKISRETPDLLKTGQLDELKLKAEQLNEDRKIRLQQLDNIFASCRKELSAAAPRLNELLFMLKEIEKIKHDDLPAPAAEKLQKIKFAIHAAGQDNRRKTELDFISKSKQLNAELDSVIKKLGEKNCDFQKLSDQLKSIDLKSNILFASSENIGSKLFSTTREFYKNLRQDAAEKYQHTIKLHQAETALRQPLSFADYCQTLENLPVNAPLLAAGDWKLSLIKLPQVKMLEQSVIIRTTLKHSGELVDLLSQYTTALASSPAADDVRKILPPEDYAAQITGFVNKMRSDYEALYKCSELVLRAPDKSIWRFYTTDAPIFDLSQSSRIPKAMVVNVMLMPGAAGTPIAFQINRSNGKIYSANTNKFKLPKVFAHAENIKLTDQQLPEAAHSIYLTDLLLNLGSCTSADQIEPMLLRELNILRKADNMNLFARAHLTGELLKLMLKLLPGYSIPSEEYLQQLNKIDPEVFKKWYEPNAEQKYQQAAESLKRFFNTFDPSAMQKRCSFTRYLIAKALDRNITPGGIVLQQSKNQGRVHNFKDLPKAHELWFFVQHDTRTPGGWVVVKKREIECGIIKLPQSIEFYNGMVFFVPTDGLDTENLTAKVKAEAAAVKIEISDWPLSWPVNCR